MPISYIIDDVKRLIYTRAEGSITYNDLKAHMNAEAGSPAVSYGEIFDCTDATTDITPQQIKDLANERMLIARRQPPGPVAIVATNNNFLEMMRMFDSYTSEVRPIRVFRYIEEAESWLNLLESYS